MSSRELLKEFINERVIFRANPEKRYNEQFVGKLVPASETNSDGFSWQIFMRRLTQNAEMMRLVLSEFDQITEDFVYREGRYYDYAFQFAGLETGSLPVVSHLQSHFWHVHHLNINTFTSRKERKSYGLFNYLEGIPGKEDVVLIDDFINSGGSMGQLQQIIYEEIDDIAIIDEWCIVKNDIEDNKHVKSIFTLDEFSLDYDPAIYWEPCDVI